jgi:UDP-N-acetyl-D-mannosaminuronic acid dehydrogenase
MTEFEYDICVVGGCGHVGLPLALTFADAGARVSIYDTNDASVATVRSGTMPFRENGAQELLNRAIAAKRLEVRNDPTLVSTSRQVIVVIGTPVDEHLNPTFYGMRRFFQALVPFLRSGQLIVLRSTVFPGTTDRINELVREAGLQVHLSFCPERIAEGHALEELRELPQIISGCDPEAEEMAAVLFGKIARTVVRLTPLEAELAKIITNSWRYIQFASANQFFMIAADYGLDFYRIHEALTHDYPRMKGFPGSGFAAGPCLFKDTMQLVAANNNNFQLGHAAMLVNEGLPNFIVKHLKERYPLRELSVGILGMAYKAESDDARSSLSYKLRKILEYEAREVLCADEYVSDPRLVPAEELVERADIVIVGAPHKRYRSLCIPDAKPVVDVWNYFGKGASLR